jgi:hypothetical protein
MTNFVDKVEALKMSMADDPKEWWTLYEHRSFFGELCDKALEAERLLREMTIDRDLWQQAHDEDCPNKALVETLEAEIAQLKGDR